MTPKEELAMGLVFVGHLFFIGSILRLFAEGKNIYNTLSFLTIAGILFVSSAILLTIEEKSK